MKHRKGRKVLIVLICVLGLVLAGLMGFIVYMETGRPAEVEEETNVPTTLEQTTAATVVPTGTTIVPTEAPEQTLPATTSGDDVSDYAVETPWGTLYYPGKYRTWLVVQTRQAPVYTVSFAARIGEDEYPLFDLHFGGNQGETLGIIADAVGNKTTVKAVMHGLEIPTGMAGADAQTLYGMQESVSYLAAQLEKPQQERPTEPQQELPTETQPQDILIETPFCSLLLPGKWEKQVRLEIRETDGYAVCFWGVIGNREEIPLFDIVLDGMGEEFLGTLVLEGGMEVAVFTNTYEVAPGQDWTQEDRDLAFSLLEMVNDVLESLRFLDNFIPAE